MEGYSVTEAASVLGVPTERVWELLARGVLSGAPEGETGMRVYLQPRPAPAPVEPKAPNGNGGAREPELSPFRELLTEFRNLTERYGQALLALGEARGEVASLRSRVDLLEARMDLRLPMGSPQAAGWSSTPTPTPVERAVMPAAPVEPAVEAPVEPEPSEEEPRARARGPRRATESFAEALARAEDPSPPELPGSSDAAAAIAALRHQPDGPPDIGLPREVAGADAIPVAETDDALLGAAVVEVAPEPVELEAEPMVEEGQPTFEPAEEPIPLVVAPVEPQSEPTADTALAETEPATVAPEPVADAPEPEPITLEPTPESEPEAEAEEPAAAAETESAAADVEPIAWDAERYTTDIEEPDWFAAEIIEPTQVVPAAEAEDELSSSATEADATPAAGSEPEEGSGADEMEVAPTGTQPDASDDAPASARAFPGARDLEEAIAALRAAGRASEPPPETAPELVADVEGGGDVQEDEWPPRSVYARPPTQSAPTRGTASRAYRRLRRIFPS